LQKAKAQLQLDHVTQQEAGDAAHPTAAAGAKEEGQCVRVLLSSSAWPPKEGQKFE
jgi:hypothetical protein